VRAETIAEMLRPEPMPVDVIRALAAEEPAVEALVLGVAEETDELIALLLPCQLALLSACRQKT
jgi:hypothetical protein